MSGYNCPVIHANEFDICVSMSDLVVWTEDEHSPNADLAAALRVAGIELDITKLYDYYFEESRYPLLVEENGYRQQIIFHD